MYINTCIILWFICMCLCVHAFMCYQVILWYCVVIQIGEHNRIIWSKINGFMIFPICLCCSKMTLLYWCICLYVIYLCIINSGVFYKMSFKLYVFMNACNVDDWFVFVKKSILKSPIIIVGQCEGIFCIMLSRI